MATLQLLRQPNRQHVALFQVIFDSQASPVPELLFGAREEAANPGKQRPDPKGNVPSPKGLKPLKSNVVKALAQLTPHENIYTVPNFLTLTRLIAAPVVGYLVLNDAHAWALGLFAYAGITDLVDGWIARKWNLQTVVGTIIDPLADKILMTVLTVTLAMQGMLP
ncbi:hypothetical protein V498_07946, partial [Pseudogymnoascus sp. VKM F-4517 (FW-2822)]